MIRRAFVRAMSCAILTSLLGVKAWRLEASEDAFGIGGFDSEASGVPRDGWELSVDFGGIPRECQWHPHRWASADFCDVNTSPRPYLR